MNETIKALIFVKCVFFSPLLCLFGRLTQVQVRSRTTSGIQQVSVLKPRVSVTGKIGECGFG